MNSMVRIDSMKKIYHIKQALPAIVIEDKTTTGFQTLEELSALLPDTLKVSTSTIGVATSTKTKK